MASHRALFSSLAALGLAVLALPAAAKPEAPRAFCETFPSAQDCQGRVVGCAHCHAGPPMLNDYGAAVGGALWSHDDYGQAPFATLLGDALMESSAGDADGDGVSNLEEIALGTGPGDAQDVFSGMAPPEGLPNPFFKVGAYDAKFAYRRLMISYCGRSPTYEDFGALAEASDKPTYLHDALNACLDSGYWKTKRSTAWPMKKSSRSKPSGPRVTSFSPITNGTTACLATCCAMAETPETSF